jgi:hypothetical protein
MAAKTKTIFDQIDNEAAADEAMTSWCANPTTIARIARARGAPLGFI